VHVEDAARAFTALAALNDAGSAYHVVGHTASMLELAETFLELFGAAGLRLEATSVSPEAVYPLLDDSAARRDFGFSPRYADVRAAAESLVPAEHRQIATTGDRRDGVTP
jgi:nucleoside-diphosphate-sugar epimerase